MTGEPPLPADPPAVAAAIAHRRKTLDRQTVMAVIGLVVVTLFIHFDAKDPSRMMQGTIDMLPWIVGLSIGIFVLNRWTLAIQTKLLRREASRAGGR